MFGVAALVIAPKAQASSGATAAIASIKPGFCLPPAVATTRQPVDDAVAAWAVTAPAATMPTAPATAPSRVILPTAICEPPCCPGTPLCGICH